MNDQTLSIRQANIEELDMLLHNENLCFQFPWSKNMLKDCLLNQFKFKEHCSFDRSVSERQYAVFVMHCNAQMVGHLIVQKILDELHLHNVCILPSHRGKKLGQKWMHYLKKLGTEFQTSQIILEVRESNSTAIHLYKNNDFKAVGVRKQYYQKSSNGSRENAIVFKRTD